MRFLSRTGHAPITSLAWSPDGQYPKASLFPLPFSIFCHHAVHLSPSLTADTSRLRQLTITEL